MSETEPPNYVAVEARQLPERCPIEASQHPHIQPAPQSARRRFDLIEARGVIQIEQPVHLRRAPAQPAGQFGFSDPSLDHGLVQAQLGALQRRRAHREAASRIGRRGQGQAGFHVERKPGFQGIHRLAQRVVLGVAEGEGFRHVGERDQHGAVVVGGQDRGIVKHGSPSFQAQLALDGGFQASAQFGGPVQGQGGLPTVEEHFQMRAFTRLERRALSLQPLLHLFRVHETAYKHICFVLQAPIDGEAAA